MLLIWRGWGILAALCGLAGLLTSNEIAKRFWGNPLPLGVLHGAEVIGMLMAAGLCLVVHRWLDRSKQERVLLDPKTGQNVTLVARHDLFYIPVKYWPYVFIGWSVLLWFAN